MEIKQGNPAKKAQKTQEVAESIKRVGDKEIKPPEGEKTSEVFVALVEEKSEEEKILEILGEDFKKKYNTLDAETKKQTLKTAKTLLGPIPKDINDPKFKKSVETTSLILSAVLDTSIKTSALIKKLVDYIKPNGKPFADKMSELVEKYPFVLLGETHLKEGYSLPQKVKDVLPRLLKETKARGEELILEVEFDEVYQPMIDNLDKPEKFKEEFLKIYPDHLEDIDKVIKDGKVDEKEFRSLMADSKHKIPKSRILGYDENDKGFIETSPDLRGQLPEIVFYARTLGIKVVPIDYTPSKHFKEMGDEKLNLSGYKGLTPKQAKRRDQKMFDHTVALAGPKKKIVFYGGYFHTSEKPMTDRHWGLIDTFGSLLSKKYGDDKVASLRSVDRASGFDGESVEKNIFALGVARMPSPAVVMNELKEKGIIIAPTGGLITTKEGKYDFVTIDPTTK